MHGQRAGLLLLLGIVAACPEPNPNFVDPTDDVDTTTSSSTTDGGTTTAEGSTGPMGTGDGGSGTTDTGTGSTSETTAAGSSSTGESSGLGFPCTEDAECEPLGAECCTVAQCQDTCMIPCGGGGQDECPMDMACAHGYCLFPCDDNDADCRMWPGYTCQHFAGTLCEKD